MEYSTEELKQKEVIALCSGKKLGYPSDFLISCDCGRIEALLLCSKGLFRKEELRVPWCDIERIGEDVIWIKRDPS